MTDFAAALSEGFDAAQRAANAFKEVDEVFEQLDGQIRQATEGRLTIKRDLREVDPLQIAKDSLENLMRRFRYPAKPKEKYWAIVAFNPTVLNSKAVALATWSQDSTGYPCKIWWAGEEHICEDKEGLANCLADLLRDPEVAAILLRVKNWRPKEQETSGTETSGGLMSADHTAGQETTSDLTETPSNENQSTSPT